MAKVRVGVIGLGMGKAHLDHYEKAANAEVVALCDVDEERLNEALASRPDVRGFANYNEMLAMAELDAVSVALPNFLHAPVTIAALEAGKHVLCEKPMAMNTAEALAMKATADRCGKLLMMHFNVRFFPCGSTLKPLMEAGTLGEVYHVTTTYTRSNGYPAPGGWFGQRDKSGGGPMIDLGVHRLDFALWLLGYPKPTSVLASTYDLLAQKKLADVDFDCEDFATAMIRFEGGQSMYLAASWDGHEENGGGFTMSIRGTEGAIFEGGGELRLCRQGNDGVATTVLDPVEPVETAQSHFVDAILSGNPPHPSAENGIVCMKILDAIYESARTGRAVDID